MAHGRHRQQHLQAHTAIARRTRRAGGPHTRPSCETPTHAGDRCLTKATSSWWLSASARAVCEARDAAACGWRTGSQSCTAHRGGCVLGRTDLAPYFCCCGCCCWTHGVCPVRAAAAQHRPSTHLGPLKLRWHPSASQPQLDLHTEPWAGAVYWCWPLWDGCLWHAASRVSNTVLVLLRCATAAAPTCA